MTTIGFTGSRFILQQTQRQLVDSRLDELVIDGMTNAVTGACIGVDQYIAEYLLSEHPDIRQTIIVPGNTDRVSDLFLDRMRQHPHIFIWHMPPDSSYRDRNERLVSLSDRVEAFWNGCKRSGTFMTMNIARKAGKLLKVTRM